jgi:plasmid stabilization system protein ParE
MKITIREEAADDFDDVFTWLAKENPAAARDVVQRIRERIDRLATPGLSHMGRLGILGGTRELIEPPYIVVYQVHERASEIEVLAVFHTKQERR